MLGVFCSSWQACPMPYAVQSGSWSKNMAVAKIDVRMCMSMAAQVLMLTFLWTSVASTSSIVETTQGLVNGTISTASSGIAVAQFKGIPFAKQPLGALRFAPPVAADAWQGVYDASEFKHNCIQGKMNMGWDQPMSTQSEDCLYLNVYAPAKMPTTPLPVLFWIFGGGFQGGGGNETRLNGTWDVALQKGELIVVTHNYRLNLFGFLAAEGLRGRAADNSTGNYGIQDQRMAMLWTQQNIAKFGGDPKKVFIVGQSAGANSVSQHLVRPQSWGLFSSAGIESGAFYDGVDTATVASQKPSWDKLARYLKCPSGSEKEVTDCIVAAPMEDLVKANMNGLDGWSITVDGVDLVAPGPILAAQGKIAKVPIIAGSVREDIASTYCATVQNFPPTPPAPKCNQLNCTEADFRGYGVSLGFNKTEVDMFVEAYKGEENGSPSPGSPWYWAQKHAGSDAWATCPSRRITKTYFDNGIPSFWYYWTHVPDGPNGHGGAHHACEQPFVFHVLSETPAQLREDGGKYHINSSNPVEVALSTQTVEFWASMADAGTPAHAWQTFSPRSSNAMLFGDAFPLPAMMIQNVRTAKCDFWDIQFAKVLDEYERGERTIIQQHPELMFQ